MKSKARASQKAGPIPAHKKYDLEQHENNRDRLSFTIPPPFSQDALDVRSSHKALADHVIIYQLFAEKP